MFDLPNLTLTDCLFILAVKFTCFHTTLKIKRDHVLLRHSPSGPYKGGGDVFKYDL
jgi:hypothetical protein